MLYKAIDALVLRSVRCYSHHFHVDDQSGEFTLRKGHHVRGLQAWLREHS